MLRLHCCNVPETILRDRILKRKNDVSDADIRVLEKQLSQWKLPNETEKPFVISIDASEQLGSDEITELLKKLE